MRGARSLIRAATSAREIGPQTMHLRLIADSSTASDLGFANSWSTFGPPMLSIAQEMLKQYRLNEAAGRPFDATVNGAPDDRIRLVRVATPELQVLIFPLTPVSQILPPRRRRIQDVGTSPKQLIRFTGWWLALLGIYLVLVGEVSLAELIFGLLSSLISAIAAEIMRQQGAFHFSIERNSIAPLTRLPREALADSALVLAADCRRPFESLDSGRFIEIEFNPGDDSAASAMRRALVTAAVSFAPNSFVVLLDAKRCRLLVHQLVPTPEKPRDKDWPL